MRAAIAFDNADDLIYNDKDMKNSVCSKLVVAALATVVTALSVFSAGCFLFKDDKLATPALQRLGSIYSWDAVDGANQYLIRTGDKSVYTESREIRISNPDDGGKLTVTAVNVENGEVTAKSDAAVIELAAINKGDKNYAEYDFTQDEEVYITSGVEKAVIISDGGWYDGPITVASRTTPLIVELYDVKCDDGFRLDDGFEGSKESCIVVRSLGENENYIDGRMGVNGSNGRDGEGVAVGGKGENGGTGYTAGSLGYVVFEGNKNLTFYGGTGGTGGNGGKPGSLQSVGGDGGNGGTGGCGLKVTGAYVCMDHGELICRGGPGGQGGYGGPGKWIPIVGYDNGDDGKPGERGVDFKGEKTEKEILTFEIEDFIGSEEVNDGGDNTQNAQVSGTYKFYSISNGEETYYIGDSTPDGDLLNSDFMVITFNGDGTCVLTYNGESASGTWEAGGNFVVLTNDRGVILTARVNGTVLEFKQDGLTMTLRK